MNKYKVAVYAISKNEGKFAERWMKSMSEADGIYVTDTGSTDNTVELLKKNGAVVNSISLSSWRFDLARNISLSFVPTNMDICVCTDLDEVFEPGWRDLLEKSWTDKTTRLRYYYTWSFNPDGSPCTTFLGEKIHARKNFLWVHPVHEVLKYTGTESDLYAEEPRIRLNHYPDSTKSRGQYLKLLELSMQEQPNDDRNMHYLGREYMFYGMWDKCIETLKKHLAMPNSLWNDERSASMRFIARAYTAKGDYQSAEKWLYRAIAEAPYLREPYIESAQLAYMQSNWGKVLFMTEEALKIKERPLTYINEGFCWDYTPYDLGAIACYNLGLKKKSLIYAEEAVKMQPNDERLKSNLSIIKKSL